MIMIMSEAFIDKFIAITDQSDKLVQGTNLFYQGDLVKKIFVVEKGRIELTRHQIDGKPIVLQRATCKTILAEASVYSSTYHCDAAVAASTIICELPKAVFLKYLKEDDAFSSLWAAHLAREVQNARYRSEILSRKTVAERLDGWLAWQENKLPEKGLWKAIASQIGITPEALYRELAKRRS